MENVQKSTELQNLLAEKFQMEGQIIPFVIFVNGRHSELMEIAVISLILNNIYINS